LEKPPFKKVILYFFIYLQQTIKVNRSDDPVPRQNGSNPFDVDDRLNILNGFSKFSNVFRNTSFPEVESKEKVEISEGPVLSIQNAFRSVHAPPWKKSRPEEDADIEQSLEVAGDGGEATVSQSWHPKDMSSSFSRISGSRKPEIGDVRIEEVVVVSSDQDVVRLQVAMTVAHPVHVHQAFSDIGQNLDGGTEGDHFNLNG
jgi:hypothetical protein